jgi:hypothetical protein
VTLEEGTSHFQSSTGAGGSSHVIAGKCSPLRLHF